MSEVPPGNPRTITAGGVMRRVHGIETGYLNIVRVTLAIAVILGVFAVGGAILRYAFVHMATTGAHGPSEYFEAPDWETIRHRVLPAPGEQQASNAGSAVQEDAPADGRRPVDERINSIADNLNAQFSRNAGAETGFTDRYPRRLLEAWVLEESGIPRAHLANYTGQLEAVSEAIGKDLQINRIGSIDDRAQVIMNALDAFRLAFLLQVEQAENSAAVANAAAAARRADVAKSSIYLGVGGLALLVSLVLIVVLLRIEVHLRNQIHLQALAQAGGRSAEQGTPDEG